MEHWRSRLGLVAMIVMIVGAVGLRLIDLNSPLLEDHSFRQTQTAFTVWSFVQKGVSLANAELPVFGPPWRVPFEFPTFQACAAWLTPLTGGDIDLACRVTHLLFFFGSAAFLYRLTRQFLPTLACAMILGVYLFSPFTVVWSRTSMIEYAAVMFALGYIDACLRWLETEDAHDGWLALAVALGCLGALTKITTMAIAVAPVGLFILLKRRRQLTYWVGCALMVGGPLVLGARWVAYGDAVKAASPLTEFITSARLKDWNYGTWQQRLDLNNWELIWTRIRTTVIPFPFSLMPLLALGSLPWQEARVRWFVFATAVSAVLPIAIFFNLYWVHNYYLCAITPMWAILVGLGLYVAWNALTPRPALRVALVAVLAFAAWRSDFSVIPPPKTDLASHRVGRLAAAVAQVTPPDGYVVVADLDWDPTMLYYAKRRGLMVRGDVLPEAELDDPGYVTLVFNRPHPELVDLFHRRGQRLTVLGQLEGWWLVRIDPRPQAAPGG